MIQAQNANCGVYVFNSSTGFVLFVQMGCRGRVESIWNSLSFWWRCSYDEELSTWHQLQPMTLEFWCHLTHTLYRRKGSSQKESIIWQDCKCQNEFYRWLSFCIPFCQEKCSLVPRTVSVLLCLVLFTIFFYRHTTRNSDWPDFFLRIKSTHVNRK